MIFSYVVFSDAFHFEVEVGQCFVVLLLPHNYLEKTAYTVISEDMSDTSPDGSQIKMDME